MRGISSSRLRLLLSFRVIKVEGENVYEGLPDWGVLDKGWTKDPGDTDHVGQVIFLLSKEFQF